MTEKANPSVSRPAEAFKTAGAIAYGGHGDSGFIVDSTNPTDLSTQDSALTHANYDNFSETSSASSVSVDIAAGEAFVYGSWLAIDTVTTVTLNTSTAGQTVYVGWNKDGSNDVIVGLQAAFDNASENTDKKIPLWTFDTDGTGVTSVTDNRQIGYTIEVEGSIFFGDSNQGELSFDTGASEFTFDNDISVPADSLDATEVDIGTGLEDDGSGAIRFDEDGSFTFTSTQTFSAGLETNADITDTGTVIWDSSAGELNANVIPDNYLLNSGDTMTGNLTMGTNDIIFDQSRLFNNATLDLDGASSFDVRNSSDTTYFSVNETGPVEVVNTALNVDGELNANQTNSSFVVPVGTDKYAQ